MGSICRPRPWLVILATGGFVWCGIASSALAQLGSQSSRFQLSDSVYVDEADSAARRHLEQIRNYLAGEQWDEAIETLRQVAENYGEKMVELTDRRYVNLRRYCHGKLASLPPEALASYRSRVDAQAENWYREGIAARNRTALRRVVEQSFASSWGDDALDALAEMALEEGDYGTARANWEMLLPPDAGEDGDTQQPSLKYPDTSLDLADIRARLVLVSILEGATSRARGELDEFAQLHPEAVGRLGGREVRYAEMLGSLLEASGGWPAAPQDFDWPTFAGSVRRNKVLPEAVDVGALEWRIALDKTPAAEGATPLSRPTRVAEDHKALLSYHPVLVGNLVLVNTDQKIHAFDLHTGEPAWGQSSSVIFDGDAGKPTMAGRTRSYGAPRFTMTVHGDKLFARMGSPITGMASDFGTNTGTGYLVCLDLSAQGMLLWKAVPEGDKWAFEGAPVSDGTNVYVAMRRSDVRPQAHVACLDAETGRERWRRMICAAETPGRGQTNEITHNLLTLDRETLYFNTNLGAVASLSTRDGALHWITLYRRAKEGSLNAPAAHFYRDLNPCIYYQGKLLVAPSDSERIFAFDAHDGQLLWETPHPEDAVHLLGVGGGNLLASGDRLWWIDVESGKLAARWPEDPSLRGYGRGLLVGDEVYWPTRKDIYVCGQRSGRPERTIPISAKYADLTGGNLLMADGYLLIATSDALVAFSQYSRLQDRLENEITLHPSAALPRYELACCYESLGKWPAAMEAYRQAIALADDYEQYEGQPLARVAARRLHELLVADSQRLAAEERWDDALRRLGEAALAAPDVAGSLQAQLMMADVWLSAGRAPEGVRGYQAILRFLLSSD